MNQIGFAKRKNSNKVLFHFDSLVDLHLAVVYALQKDYPSGGSMQSINYSFLHQSRMELKKHRIFDIGKEIIQECFLGNMRDKWQSTYKIYMEEEFDRVISDAPITPMLRLIAAFSRVGRGSHVSSSIFCENYNQARITRAMLKTIPADIIVGQPEKIDLNQYARVILGDIIGTSQVVKEGLNAEDKVIIQGLQKVREGQPVKAQLVSETSEVK